MGTEEQNEICNDVYSKQCSKAFGEIKTALNNLDVSLRGNGKPGLNSRVSAIEQFVLDVKKQEERSSNRLWELMKPILVASLAAVLGATGALKVSRPEVDSDLLKEVIQYVKESQQ